MCLLAFAVEFGGDHDHFEVGFGVGRHAVHMRFVQHLAITLGKGAGKFALDLLLYRHDAAPAETREKPARDYTPARHFPELEPAHAPICAGGGDFCYRVRKYDDGTPTMEGPLYDIYLTGKLADGVSP